MLVPQMTMRAPQGVPQFAGWPPGMPPGFPGSVSAPAGAMSPGMPPGFPGSVAVPAGAMSPGMPPGFPGMPPGFPGSVSAPVGAMAAPPGPGAAAWRALSPGQAAEVTLPPMLLTRINNVVNKIETEMHSNAGSPRGMQESPSTNAANMRTIQACEKMQRDLDELVHGGGKGSGRGAFSPRLPSPPMAFHNEAIHQVMPMPGGMRMPGGIAAIPVDTNRNGQPVMYVGVDRNGDGIPDALQAPGGPFSTGWSGSGGDIDEERRLLRKQMEMLKDQCGKLEHLHNAMVAKNVENFDLRDREKLLCGELAEAEAVSATAVRQRRFAEEARINQSNLDAARIGELTQLLSTTRIEKATAEARVRQGEVDLARIAELERALMAAEYSHSRRPGAVEQTVEQQNRELRQELEHRRTVEHSQADTLADAMRELHEAQATRANAEQRLAEARPELGAQRHTMHHVARRRASEDVSARSVSPPARRQTHASHGSGAGHSESPPREHPSHAPHLAQRSASHGHVELPQHTGSDPRRHTHTLSAGSGHSPTHSHSLGGPSAHRHTYQPRSGSGMDSERSPPGRANEADMARKSTASGRASMVSEYWTDEPASQVSDYGDMPALQQLGGSATFGHGNASYSGGDSHRSGGESNRSVRFDPVRYSDGGGMSGMPGPPMSYPGEPGPGGLARKEGRTQSYSAHHMHANPPHVLGDADPHVPRRSNSFGAFNSQLPDMPHAPDAGRARQSAAGMPMPYAHDAGRARQSDAGMPMPYAHDAGQARQSAAGMPMPQAPDAGRARQSAAGMPGLNAGPRYSQTLTHPPAHHSPRHSLSNDGLHISPPQRLAEPGDRQPDDSSGEEMEMNVQGSETYWGGAANTE